MQCKPVTILPMDEKWSFELKFDGYRCIAIKCVREVTLFSRHKKVLNKRFPMVVEALTLLEGDFVLDRGLVAINSQGEPSFQLLQNSLSQSLAISFYAFDLLNRNGEVLVNVPFSSRRELLEDVFTAPRIPSPLLKAPTGKILYAVRKLCLEGDLGKRLGSGYEPGERSGAWITEITTEKSTFRKTIILMRCEFGAYRDELNDSVKFSRRLVDAACRGFHCMMTRATPRNAIALIERSSGAPSSGSMKPPRIPERFS